MDSVNSALNIRLYIHIIQYMHIHEIGKKILDFPANLTNYKLNSSNRRILNFLYCNVEKEGTLIFNEIYQMIYIVFIF